MPGTEMLPGARPLIAILRGLTPERALDVGTVIRDSGIRIIEVPLNSPDALRSIQVLARELGSHCLCGAGTVVNVDDVSRVHAAGGRLVVSPNTNPAVIRAAIALGMIVMPGIATPTEAFAAVDAGATHLKLYPASTYGSRHLKALRDVLPGSCRVYPVGGISAADMAEWRLAGAAGFGFGSELFRPTFTIQDVAERAARLVTAFEKI